MNGDTTFAMAQGGHLPEMLLSGRDQGFQIRAAGIAIGSEQQRKQTCGDELVSLAEQVVQHAQHVVGVAEKQLGKLMLPEEVLAAQAGQSCSPVRPYPPMMDALRERLHTIDSYLNGIESMLHRVSA
jgi:hypothetical protein